MLDELAEETTSPDAHVFAAYEITNAELPPSLRGGATHVVADALRVAASIDVSRRISTETHVLANRAIRHLSDCDQSVTLLAAYVAHNEARRVVQAGLQARASDIQRKWLHVKFRAIDHPARFEPPEIYPYLDLDDASASAPEVDDDLLTLQIAQYKAVLDKRVAESREARRQEALAAAQQQKVTALRRRREVHAERHRLENIQHRWEYLVSLALRRDHASRLRRAKSAATDEADDDDVDRPPTYLAAKLFVERTLHVATLHAMWAVEMQSLAASTPDLVASDGGPVLRLCMLLCPNPFGAQFSALYQRYFAREGATIGVHFEWRVFDVGQLEFPTVALDEWAHGYLVCGGPGHDDDSLPLWHRSVVGFLAHLVSRHRRVGALGRGHSILAKALGGDVARVSPSRLDWNVLEEKVLSQQSVKTVVYAIPALHGDLVTCVPSAKVATSTPGPAYVTKFKTKTALSFDGHPECGTFVLHMLARYLHAPATDAVPECAWPRGDALVARKLVQHYLAAQKAVDGPETVLSRRLPLRRMRIFAHKSCDPMLEFLSDTNEYLAFAFSENVDVVVLPICLSADKHPIVFGSTHLEALTDLAAIFPSYVHAHPPRVAVSDLSLAELKALTILHAFPNASGLKSPRGRGGYAGASESNRLQTLTTVLQFLARLHTAQRTSPLEIAFTFPEENESTFSAHDRDHIDELYTILRGALRVLHADMDDAIHVVSRDMPFLSTLHKLHPRWRTVLVVPRSIATPLRMTLQHDALAIAHFADAILIPKSHPVLLPDENNDSIAQIYHRAGVHVYVDLNDPYPTSLSLVKEHIKCQCLRVDGVFVSNPHTALDGFRLFASGHSYVDEVYEDIRQSFGLVAAMAEHEKLQRQIEPQNITYAHHAYQFPGNESASWSQRLRHLSPVMDHVLRLIAVDGDVEMERQVRGNYYSAPKRALPARPVTGRPLPLAVTAPVLGTSQQGRRCRTRVPGKRHTIGSLAAPCSPVVDRSEDIRSPERVMSVNQCRSVAPPSKSPLVTARRLRPPNR